MTALTREVFEAAHGVAERLDAGKLRLTIVEKQPLAALLRATDLFAGAVTKQPDQTWHVCPDAIIANADIGMQVGGQAVNDLDVALETVVERLALPALRGQIAFARTTVRAEVLTLAESVSKAMENFVPEEYLRAEVRVDAIADIHFNQTWTTVAQSYTMGVGEPALAFNFPIWDVEQIRTAMATGLGDVDQDVARLIKARGDAWLMRIWTDYFTTAGLATMPRDMSRRLLKVIWAGQEDGRDQAVVVALLARGLFNRPSENEVGTLATYSAAMAVLRDYAAQWWVGWQRENLTQTQAGSLVKFYDRKNLRVHVNEALYQRFLKEGGSNEVLLGGLVIDDAPVRLEGVLAEVLPLQNAWTRFCTNAQVSAQLRRHTYLRQYLVEFYQSQIANDTDAQEFARIMGVFKTTLQGMSDAEVDNLSEAALALVCKSRYPRHSAFEILTGISDAIRRNSSMDVGEAAFYSILNYVTDWFADQMRVVK